jgi:mono/diheme cytochrome c family protein
MLKKNLLDGLLVVIFLVMVLLQTQCSSPQEKAMTKDEMIKRGAYLVNFGGCNDCHSPKVFTDMGPVPDTTKLLSGHQDGLNIPRVDTSLIGPGKWYLSNGDLTSWVGPWGISFSANLTPDVQTGVGAWTEEMFIRAMRNGLHLGAGRPILPPMPFMGLAGLNDEDLKSVFAYLKSIKPISNKVPDPVPPNEVAARYGK